MLKYKISITDKIKSKNFSNVEIPLLELQHLLTKYPDKIGKKNETSKGFVGGQFEGTRNNANLISRSLIVLDMDHFEGSLQELELYIEKQDISKYKFIAYSTASHTYMKPRIRMVFFPDKEISKYMYPTVVKDFVSSIDKLKNYIDVPASSSPSHWMNLPERIHEDYTPWTRTNLIGDEVEIKTSQVSPSQAKVGKNILNISTEAILDILSRYDVVFCTYHQWLEVGEALHHHFQGMEKGFEIWDNWSKPDTKRHDTNHNRNVYNSFSLDKEKLLTMATIIKRVKDAELLEMDDSNIYSLCQRPIKPQDWPHTEGKAMRPIMSEPNYEYFLNHHGIKVYSDVILKKDFISIKGVVQPDYSGCITEIEINAGGINKLPLLKFNDFLQKKARSNKVNSFKDIILKTPKPSKLEYENELERWFSTVIVENENEEIKRIYMLKWITQMVHITCLNEGDNGKVARYVLVFNGDQGIGKTSWFKKLLPSKYSKYLQDGVCLNVTDAMSVLASVKHVFVELGELASTFRKSDINQLKAFITQNKDTINRKYVAEHIEYRRHTVFFGSVNDDSFLNDDTGSDRFWVLPVLKCDFNTDVDMMMIYRGIYEQEVVKKSFDTGSYVLSKEENLIRLSINKGFEPISPLKELLSDTFDLESENTDWKNCSEVLQLLGYQTSSINKKVRNEMAKVLKEHGLPFNKKIFKFKLPKIKRLL